MRGKEQDDHGSVGSGLTPLVPSPSASGLVAQPSGVLAPCIVTFQLGAILEQLSREYADQPEWTDWVRATITSASHWVSRAHLISEGVATTPTADGEASKPKARATEPKSSPPSNHTEESKP